MPIMYGASERVEREMSRNQLGIVDTCFEEGQYEAGIATLDQLRSPEYKPSASHIRQLLFLVLYPNANPSTSHDKCKEPENSATASPRKVKNQQKSPVLPTPTARDAAMRVLTSFAITNTPGALLRALPSYPTTGEPDANGVPDWGDDDDDSFIAKEAICIKGGKSCWAILKGGFIQRKKLVMTTPKAKGKKRRRNSFEQEDIFVGEDAEPPSIVSENAWPVLVWLVGLFERDEELTEAKGLPRHSPLLLSQIPSPRSGIRWEADAPLDIVSHCFDQNDERRHALGTRLLSSLINLTSTIHFDMQLFVAAVFTRLSGFSQLWELFSYLPVSVTISKFKIALCRKYIVDHTSTRALRAQPSAMIRAQPRALRASSSRHEVEKATSTATAISIPNPSIASKNPTPSCSEIIQLLENNINSESSMRYKFELLVAYSNLPVEDKDPKWRELLGDASTIEKAFGGEGMGSVYRASVNSFIHA